MSKSSKCVHFNAVCLMSFRSSNDERSNFGHYVHDTRQLTYFEVSLEMYVTDTLSLSMVFPVIDHLTLLWFAYCLRFITSNYPSIKYF